MLAATVFDLSKGMSMLSVSDVLVFGTGFITAFISALWVVRWLLKFVSNRDFKPFAYYRIVFGGLLLAFYFYSK